MKRVLTTGLLLAVMIVTASGDASISFYIPEGTYKKTDTVTETFERFMGAKYNSGMSAIRKVNVCSEAEAALVSNSSGASLVYTERTIFQPTVFQMIIFGPAWGPMQGRYPIEMWKELRERTNESIREWITGGDGAGVAHGERSGDLSWIIENGFMGAGAASGWGFDTEKRYQIGGGATVKCAVGENRSYVMTITIPLDDYFHDDNFFELNGNDLLAKITFNPVVSSLMKTSRLFKSDTFTMQPVY